MSFIRAVPELRLILDPTTGVLAEEREDVVEYSLSPIGEKLDELDMIVTDMMNQLGPKEPLLLMFPGREKASYNAGITTNAYYGVVVGFIVMFVLLILMKLGGR